MMLRKLTTIFMISFVTVSSFFLISVSMISYKIFFDFTSEEISKTRLALVNEGMRKVSTLVTRVSDAGMYIVTNRGLMHTFSDDLLDGYKAIVEQRDLTKFINDVSSFDRGIHSIEIYTDRYEAYSQIAEGNVYPIKMIEEESWFERFEKMDNGWISKHISPVTKESVVSYFHRILGENGRTKGYVKINVLPSMFFDSLSDIDLMKDDGSLMLFDSGGRMIDQSHTINNLDVLNHVITRDPENRYSLLNEPYIQKNNYYKRLGIDKQNYLLIISKPTNEQWRLAHLVDIDSLYSDTRKMRWIIVLLGLASLIFFIPIAYVVVKKLTQPLNNLIRGMKQVRKGNLQTYVKPVYIKEYNILTDNFNQMTYELNHSLQKLDRENKEKRAAEIRMLQNQIIPHFLYNTLDMIHWRALDYGAEDISFMVNQLSKMSRIAVSGGQTFILLRDEIEHARCYIDLQSARLKVEIEFSVTVRPKLKDIYVPKVILQPLIENSIKHGYSHDVNDPIKIGVDVNRNREFLEIDIIDNGMGFPENWSLNQSTGIGIKNIQERIDLYFGKTYGLTFYHSDGRSKVRITLPLLKNKPT